jgi:hypothetical protein
MTINRVKKWKIWGGIITLFLFGVITGSLTTVLLMKHHYKNILIKGPPPINRLMTGYMTRNLELSDKQCEEIRKITDRYSQQMMEISQQARMDIRDITEQQAEEIKNTLNDSQRTLFERNIKNLKERFRQRKNRREDFRGPPSPHQPPHPGSVPPRRHPPDSLEL